MTLSVIQPLDCVCCEICGKQFGQITNKHLSKHGITFDEYRKRYPDAITLSSNAREKISQNASSNPKIGFKKGHQINKDRPAWNNGLDKHSDIRMKHLSDTLAGRTLPAQWRTRISKSRKSLYDIGAIERLTGVKNPMFGKIISVEEKERRYGDGFGKKVSDGIKVFTLTGHKWGRSGVDNPMFGRKMSEEEKARRYDDEFCRRVSKGAKASFARGQRKPCKVCFTKPEIKMMGILDFNFRDEWRYTGNHSFWITFADGKHKNPDFIHRHRRVALEVFGRFWHKPEEEKYLIDRYREKGWECIVVWEDEIEKHTPNSIKMIVNSASQARKVEI